MNAKFMFLDVGNSARASAFGSADRDAGSILATRLTRSLDLMPQQRFSRRRGIS
jgi:hypothetical protein